jgi:hypothetical protein
MISHPRFQQEGHFRLPIILLHFFSSAAQLNTVFPRLHKLGSSEIPVADESFDPKRPVAEIAGLDHGGYAALELLLALLVPSHGESLVVIE